MHGLAVGKAKGRVQEVERRSGLDKGAAGPDVN